MSSSDPGMQRFVSISKNLPLGLQLIWGPSTDLGFQDVVRAFIRA